MKKSLRIPKTPKLHIRVLSDAIPTRRGWFADCYAVAKYRSKSGEVYEIFAPLDVDAAKNLANHLLFSGRVPPDFVSTFVERKRLSKLIADQLNAITSRHVHAYKARGYPVRFKAYQ